MQTGQTHHKGILTGLAIFFSNLTINCQMFLCTAVEMVISEMTTLQQNEGDGAECSVWRMLSRLRHMLCDECVCKNDITLSVLFPCCFECNLIFLHNKLLQGNSTQLLKTQSLIAVSQSYIHSPQGKKSIVVTPSIVRKNSHLVHRWL